MPDVQNSIPVPKKNLKTTKTKTQNGANKEKPKRQRKKLNKKENVQKTDEGLNNILKNPTNSLNKDNVMTDTEIESNNEVKLLKRRNRAQLGTQSKKEDICSVCEEPGDLISCTNGCCSFFHINCIKSEIPKNQTSYVCELCVANKLVCFICNETDSGDGLGEIKRCTVQNCGKSYHSTCLEIKMLKYENSSEVKSVCNKNQIRCPLHFCDTCAVKSVSKSKMQARPRYFKCVRCPTAYHIGDECIAAGSVILSGFNIICPIHFKPQKSLKYHHAVHVSWCFICSQGGKLICCSSCPAAFHAECMNMEREPEEDFYCRDCRRGIQPLYGDLVWIKLGTYRWWPGEVVHPFDIPDNIMRLRHDIGEFVTQFLGSRDYFWLNRCRVFLYQDGDATTGTTTKYCSKGISTIFKKALAEADQLFAEKTEMKMSLQLAKTAKNDKKPAPYKHIKVNRPVGRVQIYVADLKEIPRCSCKISDPRPCSSESECINHMLLYECHPDLCPSGQRCENQRFQKCLYPKSEIFKTSWGGWGLKTSELIKKGEFVSEYVGELVDEEECKKRIEKSHINDVSNYYMLTIDKDRIIDAGPKGNYSRFMNHSCDPNCETQKWTVNGDTRVGLFATKDIEIGTELTFNYNLDCLGNDKTTCKCGAKNCSGYIGERPKPQLQNGMKKEANKKKKRVKKMDPVQQHEDLCFRCRNTGILLVCCDFKNCFKAYCLDCLHVTKPPYGKWECPWHHCDWCGRKALYHCHFCPNSFCSSHIPNQLKPSVPNLFDCCLDHNVNTAEFELNEALELVKEKVAESPENTMLNNPITLDGIKQIQQPEDDVQLHQAVFKKRASAASKPNTPKHIQNKKKSTPKGKRKRSTKPKNKPQAPATPGDAGSEVNPSKDTPVTKRRKTTKQKDDLVMTKPPKRTPRRKAKEVQEPDNAEPMEGVLITSDAKQLPETPTPNPTNHVPTDAEENHHLVNDSKLINGLEPITRKEAELVTTALLLERPVLNSSDTVIKNDNMPT